MIAHELYRVAKERIEQQLTTTAGLGATPPQLEAIADVLLQQLVVEATDTPFEAMKALGMYVREVYAFPAHQDVDDMEVSPQARRLLHAFVEWDHA